MDTKKTKPDDPTKPVADLGKRTTKVNMGIIAGVLFFIMLGTLAMCRVKENPPENQHEVVPEITPSVP